MRAVVIEIGTEKPCGNQMPGCALQSDASALVREPLVQQRARKDVSVGSSMLFEPGKRGDANVELRHGASSCHSCSPVRPIPQDNANGHRESLEAQNEPGVINKYEQVRGGSGANA